MKVLNENMMTNQIKKAIESDKIFANGLDKLDLILKHNILNGKIKVKKSDIKILGEIPNLKNKCIFSIEKINEMVKGHKNFIKEHPDWKIVYGI